MKALICGALAMAALGGCVAVPAYPDAAYYPAPGYYPPPPAASVYVAPPSIYFGGGYYRGGGYRGYHHWH